MTRTELAEHIQKRYGAEAEFPWVKYPNFMVFRRNDNKKWFAVVMDLSGRKLGLPSDEVIDVMNLKCDHILLPCSRDIVAKVCLRSWKRTFLQPARSNICC